MASRTERKLREDVAELGLGAYRLKDTRGTQGDHEPGDVWVGRATNSHGATIDASLDTAPNLPHTDLYFVEEKYSTSEKSKYISVDCEQVDALIEMAEAFGATPVLAVRWSQRTDWSPGPNHHLKDVRSIERTESGNISVKPEQAAEWPTTEEYFS